VVVVRIWLGIEDHPRAKSLHLLFELLASWSAEEPPEEGVVLNGSIGFTTSLLSVTSMETTAGRFCFATE